MNNKTAYTLFGALVGFLIVGAFWTVLAGWEAFISTLNIPGAIVGALVGFMIGRKKDDEEYYASKKENPNQLNQQQEKNATSMLLDYKKLLDAGIITQEEFDNKKEELLKEL